MTVKFVALTVFPSFPDGQKVGRPVVFVLDHRVFVLDRVFGLRSSFLGLRFWVFVLDTSCAGCKEQKANQSPKKGLSIVCLAPRNENGNLQHQNIQSTYNTHDDEYKAMRYAGVKKKLHDIL